MANNFHRLAHRLKARELESRILRDFDQIEQKSKDKEDFLKKIIPLLLRIFRADYCFLVFKENGDYVTNAEYPSDKFDEELFIRITENLITSKRPLIVSSTKHHPKLRRHNFRSFIAIGLSNGKGAVILGYRRKKTFIRLDGWKLLVIGKALANSLEKTNVKEELKTKNKELEIIERIDYLQETISEYPKLISAILKEIKKEIEFELGYFYLKGEKEEFIVVGKSSESALVKQNKQTLINIAEETLEESELREFDYINADIQNGLCTPFSTEKSQGVIGVINTEISDYPKRLLKVVAKQISSAVSEDWEKAQIKSAFSRYVSPEIIENMLKNQEEDYLKTKKDEVTVLFSDVRGFTKLAEKAPPEKIVEMLNDHFNIMTEIILRNKGMVDKFLGDGIMAVWGAPIYLESQAFRAVKAALEMQEAQKELEKKYAKQGIKFQIGVGINTGEAIIGNVGSELKMDYTIMGDTPNTASRICGAAKPGQVLISESTYRESRKSIKSVKLPPIEAKNKSYPVQVYEVTGIKSGY